MKPMEHFSIKKLLSSLAWSLSLLAVFAFTLTGNAYAATPSHKSLQTPSPWSISLNTPSTSPIDFRELQKTCAVLSVHMQGATHTVTCLRAKLNSSNQVSPNIGRDDPCDE